MIEKPFALFIGDDYYPSGGFLDLHSMHANLDQANDVLDALGVRNESLKWWHVVDLRIQKIVLEKVYPNE